MGKTFKSILSVICVVILCGFCFVGCAVSGSNAIKAISFNKPVYYADIECPLKLDYKVYPSTANNFTITYSNNHINYYTLESGIINISQLFSSVEISINAGGVKDTCNVVKKRYPEYNTADSKYTLTGGKSIYLSHSTLGGNYRTPEITQATLDTKKSIMLTSNMSTNLQMYGVAYNYETKTYNTTWSLVNGEIYDFELVSSDPTVIEIIDSESMQIKSTGKVGQSTITAYFINSAGQYVTSAGRVATSDSNAYKCRLDVKVVEPVSDMKIYYNNALVGSNVASIVGGNISDTVVNYYVYLVDKDNNYIEEDAILSNVSAVKCCDIAKVGYDDNNIVITSLGAQMLNGVKCVQISVKVKSGFATSYEDKILFSCNYLVNNSGEQIYKLVTLSNGT